MRVWMIAAAIVVVLGGGVAVAAFDLMGDESTAVSLVPADALGYVHLTLDPSVEQKRELLALAKRLPEDARKQLEASVPKALDDALGEVDLDFDDDIKPWLGGEVAAYAGGDDLDQPEFAVLVETTDPEMTLKVVGDTVTEEVGEPDEETHREVTYSVIPETGGSPDNPEAAYAVVGDFLVAGTTDGVKAVIDTSSDGGIQGDAGHSELVGLLTEDRLLTYWLDTPRLFDAALQDLPEEEAQTFTASPLFSQQEPSAGAVLVDEQSLVFEAAAAKPEEEGFFQSMPADTGLMASLPDDTWFSLVVPGIGKNAGTLMESLPPDIDVEQFEAQFTAETGLDLRADVLAWMEDAALFVAGDSVQQLGGGLVIRSNDAEATSTFLQRLVDRSLADGLAVRPTTVGGLSGFTLADASIPPKVTALSGDRLVIAVDAPEVSEEDSAIAGAAGEGPRLDTSAAFTNATAALGQDYAPVFYVDIAAATRVLKSTFGESSVPPEFTQAEPYLEPLSHVIAGTADRGEHLLQRIVIGTTE